MKQTGISKSILSISSPGTYLAGSSACEAEKLTTYCNDYAADLKRKYPEKFGFWASLPLPNTDLALKEIERVQNLGVDGFTLLTNAHGHYLGDEIFDTVFRELNKRKATIFIHPTTPCLLCNEGMNNAQSHMEVGPLGRKFASPVFEFMFDTARMLVNLFVSGTVARNPDINFIIPHLGGAMPPILSRFTGFSAVIPHMPTVTQDDVKRALQRQFYFDLAGFAFPTQIIGLVYGVGIDHHRLLYGSDFPFTPAAAVRGLATQLDREIMQHFSTAQSKDILHQNAEILLGARISDSEYADCLVDNAVRVELLRQKIASQI